jgi:modulator of FtsH protease
VNALQPWADYFVAQAGASAALTGLIFVVLSFNFDHIVSDRTWLGRAGTGLVLLVQPMLYGLVALFGSRTAGPAAWGLAVVAAGAIAALVRITVATSERDDAHPVADLARRLSFIVAGSVLELAGGLALAAGWSGGAYFLAVGSLASLIIGLMIAWILLVEVRRLTGFGAGIPAAGPDPPAASAGPPAAAGPPDAGASSPDPAPEP